MDEANAWRRTWSEHQQYFLPVVCRVASGESAAAVGPRCWWGEQTLPPAPWLRGPAAEGWALRRAASWMRGRRRVGLDLKGLRIVLIASMLQEMLASPDSPLVPGAVAAEHIIQIAGKERVRASNACTALREQMRPLFAGVEYAQSRLTVLQGSSNHITGELQRAICPLSLFSLRDLVTCFSRGSPYFHVSQARLYERTHALMVVKPAEGYEEFLEASLDLFLPLIGYFRTRLCAGSTPSDLCNGTVHPLGDLLRTLPEVRAWDLDEDEELLLSRDQVRAGPPELMQALLAMASKRGAVAYKRRGTVERFVLCGPALRPMLGMAPGTAGDV